MIHAQNNIVRLVDIQSSECGGMYYVEPHFLSKETIGDTTYIRLSCSNNCAGYNNPEVRLSADSVLISIHYGSKTTRLKLLNGKYITEEDINSHPKDSILEEVTETFAACDCCFTFDLKILGLDSSKQYQYFYNEVYIDPNYKPIESFELTNFFRQTEYETCEQVYKILSKKEEILTELNQGYLTIRLSVDTITGTIKEIDTDFDRLNERRTINKKLKKYFYSISPINCVTDPFEHRKLEKYWIRFKLNRKSKELEMTYQLGDKVIIK